MRVSDPKSARTSLLRHWFMRHWLTNLTSVHAPAIGDSGYLNACVYPCQKSVWCEVSCRNYKKSKRYHVTYWLLIRVHVAPYSEVIQKKRCFITPTCDFYWYFMLDRVGARALWLSCCTILFSSVWCFLTRTPNRVHKVASDKWDSFEHISWARASSLRNHHNRSSTDGSNMFAQGGLHGPSRAREFGHFQRSLMLNYKTAD